MRRTLGAGLAWALIATTGAGRTGRAEPAPPQVSPIHLQREDAQRLRDLQRTLDRDHPIPAAASAATAPAPQPPASGGGGRATGYVLLGVAGVAGLASISFLTGGDSDDTAGVVLLVGAALAGIIGVATLVSSRSRVQVAPTVAAGSVGLSIMGRM